MKKIVDGRGLACPQPVIKTKNALEEGKFSELEVIVDNKPASQNVQRFAENMGNTVTEILQKAGNYHVIIKTDSKVVEKIEKNKPKISCPDAKIIFISSNILGKGSQELGALLMKSFLYTLTQLQCKPKKLILMNSGVKLAVQGSEALANLQTLQKDLQILVCGTCLDYFGLKDKLAVGSVSNMYEIAENLTGPDKVLTL
jgi:tRNA 2-thiouridine synthesizing protein A